MLSRSRARRWPTRIARTRNACSAGPNTASPASIAYCASRNWCAKHTCHTGACPRWHTYRSDTHTSGRAPSSTLSGSAFERLGRSTCSTAPVPRNTHSHHLRPCTRADVSSEHTTRLPRTRSRIASACSPNRPCTRRNRFASAPSLLSRPNTSRNNARKRS